MPKYDLPDDPNYRVEGLPSAIRGKTTSMIRASMEYARIGAKMPDEYEGIEQSFLGARYNLESTVMTLIGANAIAKAQRSFQEILKNAHADTAMADKSAGTAWRLLRRYKYRTRELVKENEDLKKQIQTLSRSRL